MSIIRYRPMSLLNELHTEMDDLFRRQISSDKGDLSNVVTSEWLPAVDVKEEADKFVLIADVPGVDPKDIEVHMEGGVLTIHGEKKTESKEKKEGYLRTERFSGVFYRRFSLPENVDSEKIKATTKKGVLKVVIPKAGKSKPKSIEVRDEE